MLASNLEVVERRIRALSYEHAYAFAADGTLILDTTDFAPASIGFTADQLSLLRNASLTHNHPGGRSLSQNDVFLAMEADLAQIRAVTASHRFWINRPLQGWTPDYQKRVRTAITAEKGLLIRHLERDISGGRISPEAANRGFHHLLWSNLASRGVVRYAHGPWED